MSWSCTCNLMVLIYSILSFLWDFLYRQACCLQIETVLFLLFQYVCLPFPFLAIVQWLELLVLSRIRGMTANILSHLALDLRGTASTLPLLSMRLAVSSKYSVDVLYEVDEVPLISSVLRIFIMNECWNLSDAFSMSTDIIICPFFFSLLI